jgi:Rieske Fe-S protein
LEPGRNTPHTPGPSLWPVGFSIGVVVLLVGLIVGWPIVILGAILAAGFGGLWVRDLATGGELTHAPDVNPEVRGSQGQPAAPAPVGGPAMPEPEPGERFPRSRFLEFSTLGLGGVIGGIVTLPSLGFAVGPAFLKQGRKDVDIGPLEDYPEGQYVVATFMENVAEGEVSRRTAFVRNNGSAKVGTKQLPSFTIISNRCAHLGCPVQANGPMGKIRHEKTGNGEIQLHEAQPAGFGCPCHGGQYDTEGNRTAGPPVRGLDRYDFEIKNGRLVLLSMYSVSKVEGTGAQAKIHKYKLAGPGEHVDGVEQILYPLNPPHH